MKVILFVCTANICRSPMAEGLLRRKLEQEGLSKSYEVRSAGLWAMDGRPASPYAIRVMAERGIDISGHKAHSLDLKDIEEADLILTMESDQAESLRLEFPEHRQKIFMLSEMVGRRYDVFDPYGGPLTEYRLCAAELEELIEEGFPRIKKLVDWGED